MMEKVYDPKKIEQKWYQFWEDNKMFVPKAKGHPYCIMIPPPNVTGTLHMGHAFQNTLMDSLTRFHRMIGHKTLWQVGTDHAGIATQMVVERKLSQEGVSRHDLGRDKFIEQIWNWKKQSGDTICNQLRRLGASVDWSRERFTMDEGLSKAVQQVFIQLYKEGIIYRGKRLVNWDPVLHTAVSDLEVIASEEDGSMWHIKYPIVGSNNEFVTVSTTRPETMLGDVAVAVHPDDQRYQNLIGKKLLLPIVGREIPIIADEYVEQEFGTGCVKITPAHDFNDYDIGKRHNLPLINILTDDATINEHAPQELQDLDRFIARDKIVSMLKEQQLLVKVEDHKLSIPRGDRSSAILEPYLTDQWYVKVEDLAKPAIAAVESGEIKFVPENWSKTYFEWMKNIDDWCISRQLWWGHRIPAWYDEQGNIYVGVDEAEVRSQHNIGYDIELKQDADVLDTWFSSALWPFSTLGWPDNTHEFKEFYPTNVLVTGFDIIFFWVARMIMFGLKFTGKIPFNTVYIHGLIQDHLGQKMSKSKGNVIDPLDIIDGISLDDLLKKRTSGLMQPQMAKSIEKHTKAEYPEGISAYGTDALRFCFCSIATPARHLRFDIAKVESYRNFCNKIWNAARYVLMNTQGVSSSTEVGPKVLTIADKWIYSKWQQTKARIIENFAKYRFDLITHEIFEFAWNEYCDWYLELSKPILSDPSASEITLRGTKYTLVHILEEMMRVMHPIMPYITEEIWEMVAPVIGCHDKSLISSSFPLVEKDLIDEHAQQVIDWKKEFIVSIRNIRGEMNISPNKELTILLAAGDLEDRQLLQAHQHTLLKLAKLESLVWVENEAEIPKQSAMALCGELKIYIPFEGLIDVNAEIARLEKEVAKFNKDLAKALNKLDNPNYINKAPAEIVAKERDKVDKLQDTISQLKVNLAKFAQ